MFIEMVLLLMNVFPSLTPPPPPSDVRDRGRGGGASKYKSLSQSLRLSQIPF
jgi:hypothetical protein